MLTPTSKPLEPAYVSFSIPAMPNLPSCLADWKGGALTTEKYTYRKKMIADFFLSLFSILPSYILYYLKWRTMLYFNCINWTKFYTPVFILKVEGIYIFFNLSCPQNPQHSSLKVALVAVFFFFFNPLFQWPLMEKIFLTCVI